MSIFNNIFGGNSNGSSLKEFWNEIESSEDLEAAIESSKLGKVVIFKHSTRCMISKTVLRNFERQIESESVDLPKFYYLDLLNHRDISNEINQMNWAYRITTSKACKIPLAPLPGLFFTPAPRPDARSAGQTR